MKDIAHAIDRWYKENPRLGSVVSAIPTALAIMYLGEVIAALLGGRSPNYSPWQGGLLDSEEGWIGLIVASVVIVIIYILVRRQFRRYVGKP